jgi:hypothetical protein
MQENSKQYTLNSRLGLQPNLQNYNYNCFTYQRSLKFLPLHALCGIYIPTNKIFMLNNFTGLPLYTESKQIFPIRGKSAQYAEILHIQFLQG